MLRLTVTGSGTPLPCPGRAGPGALVDADGLLLQFDAGRATVLRLAEAGVNPASLTALFVTHHHSDHLMDVADVLLTRWVCKGEVPFPVIAPAGPATDFLGRLTASWEEDIRVRALHGRRPSLPELDVVAFTPGEQPQVVWERGPVRVSAVEVHHEPVVPAVAYRVDTEEGSAVISGDTRVCTSLETLAEGCDLLLHEVVLGDLAIAAGMPHVAAYHADARELGTMAQALAVTTLVLSHLEPSPRDATSALAFVEAVRSGGYTGQLVVARDLLSVDHQGSIW